MKSVEFVNSDILDYLRARPNGTFNITIGSPPYPNKMKRYGREKKEWHWRTWVNWMYNIVEECNRVTDGYSLFVVNNHVKDGQYFPSHEALLDKLTGAHSDLIIKRPIIWHKNAGSSSKQYLRNDHETIIVVCKRGFEQKCNWSRIARPPKYRSGGSYRQRNTVGDRVAGSAYPKVVLANPGDVLRYTVGGGHMGWDKEDDRLACSCDAPFPLKLVRDMVTIFSEPKDRVLDPFIGSGTTAVACVQRGRACTGVDLDAEPIEVAKQRISRTKFASYF